MLVHELLKEHTRFDLRDFLTTRSTSISKLNTFYLLTKGDTQLHGSFIKQESKPLIDRPNEGIITFNCIINNKRSDKLTNIIYKIFLNQKSIDLESLCLEFGKRVINLYVELKFLNLDGNMYEPAIDLVNYMLNDLQIEINFFPRCFYFVIFNDIIIRDPTEKEDQIKELYYLFVLKSKNEFIFIEKIGIENEIDDLYQIMDIVSHNFDN
ncbi:exosome complex exonuclease rrp45 [Vairimorpha apis BRL 01]|uniref:Exosome complex exonuclease rrp45 n=1 Tax=Vairimorpha apis BRL 01 TaxID=1037528 RepID=T0L7K3_9MICR|nr:exosome complex exonuclease rrp45 [Vairimorpha apis BRL 01]